MPKIKVVYKDEEHINEKSADEKLFALLEFTINSALMTIIPFVIGFYMCSTRNLLLMFPFILLMLLTPELDIGKEKIQFRIKRVF